MAISQETRNELNEWLGNLVVAAGVDPSDFMAILNIFYDHFETAKVKVAVDAELAIQRSTNQSALNAQQIADLEAQGYTVTPT